MYSGGRRLVQQGRLVEYSDDPKALTLVFEFNPTTITRTRAVTVTTGGSPGSRGGYDFASASEVPRASQGVSVEAESFSFKILLDASDRMNAGESQAQQRGVEPEISVLRSMVEPKTRGNSGAQTLAALGEGNPRAFSHHEFSSVLLFIWGEQVLPVFLTQVQIEGKDYLPSLKPYRAEATLTVQVIESRNPFYDRELQRQTDAAQQFSDATQSKAGQRLPF